VLSKLVFICYFFLNINTPSNSYYSLLIRMYLLLKYLYIYILAKSIMDKRIIVFYKREYNN
jgi:hypothetical protein